MALKGMGYQETAAPSSTIGPSVSSAHLPSWGTGGTERSSPSYEALATNPPVRLCLLARPAPAVTNPSSVWRGNQGSRAPGARARQTPLSLNPDKCLSP